MPDGLVERVAQREEPADRRLYGIAVGQVINNVDTYGQARVQVRLPWPTNIKPWARVATPMGGMKRGMYFIPQVGDEVLVAFNHGDIRDSYVIGSLWNALDAPPTKIPTDAINKRIIRTPMGHEIEFDDLAQSITITSSTKQRITIDPSRIELATTGDTAAVSLDKEGNLSIHAARSIELKANSISIEGNTVKIKSNSRTNIDGGRSCDIRAAQVKIN